jgi:hypothetical protein
MANRKRSAVLPGATAAGDWQGRDRRGGMKGLLREQPFAQFPASRLQ